MVALIEVLVDDAPLMVGEEDEAEPLLIDTYSETSSLQRQSRNRTP